MTVIIFNCWPLLHGRASYSRHLHMDTRRRWLVVQRWVGRVVERVAVVAGKRPSKVWSRAYNVEQFGQEKIINLILFWCRWWRWWIEGVLLVCQPSARWFIWSHCIWCDDDVSFLGGASAGGTLNKSSGILCIIYPSMMECLRLPMLRSCRWNKPW